MDAGVIPVLVRLLDTDMQYQGICALQNLVGYCKNILPSILYVTKGAYSMLDVLLEECTWSGLTLVQTIFQFMDGSGWEFQGKACYVLNILTREGESCFLCLRISCSSPAAENSQLEITKANNMNTILHLLQSTNYSLFSPALLLVHTLTIQPMNGSLIIEAGFLQPLINLLAFRDIGMVQLHAAEALNNLAANTEKNKLDIVNAGAVQSIKELVMEATGDVQMVMVACIRNL